VGRFDRIVVVDVDEFVTWTGRFDTAGPDLLPPPSISAMLQAAKATAGGFPPTFFHLARQHVSQCPWPPTTASVPYVRDALLPQAALAALPPPFSTHHVVSHQPDGLHGKYIADPWVVSHMKLHSANSICQTALKGKELKSNGTDMRRRCRAGVRADVSLAKLVHARSSLSPKQPTCGTKPAPHTLVASFSFANMDVVMLSADQRKAAAEGTQCVNIASIAANAAAAADEAGSEASEVPPEDEGAPPWLATPAGEGGEGEGGGAAADAQGAEASETPPEDVSVPPWLAAPAGEGGDGGAAAVPEDAEASETPPEDVGAPPWLATPAGEGGEGKGAGIAADADGAGTASAA
jgi:hypothetical protein